MWLDLLEKPSASGHRASTHIASITVGCTFSAFWVHRTSLMTWKYAMQQKQHCVVWIFSVLVPFVECDIMHEFCPYGWMFLWRTRNTTLLCSHCSIDTIQRNQIWEDRMNHCVAFPFGIILSLFLPLLSYVVCLWSFRVCLSYFVAPLLLLFYTDCHYNHFSASICISLIILHSFPLWFPCEV